MVPIAVMPSPIGQRVRELREQRGWLIKELAAEAHLKVSWVQAIETGEIGSVRADRLQALADALRVPVAYLITGNDDTGHPMDTEDALFRSLARRAKQKALDLLRAAQDNALDVQYAADAAEERAEDEEHEPCTGTEGHR